MIVSDHPPLKNNNNNNNNTKYKIQNTKFEKTKKKIKDQ